MTKRIYGVLTLCFLFNTHVSSQNYTVGTITAGHIEITSEYDTCKAMQNAAVFVAPYKKSVDSLVCHVVGHSAQALTVGRPESLLSNWTADVLLAAARKECGKVDFAVTNIGSIRSSFPKGEITVGDVLEMCPFQNMLTVLTLKGSDVIELFQQFSSFGGEGLSHGVQLHYDSKFHLVSARLNGKDIKPGKTYRIATIDYLAEGNDNLKAFKKAVESVKTSVLVRDIYMGDIKAHEAKGQPIDAKMEGRIIKDK